MLSISDIGCSASHKLTVRCHAPAGIARRAQIVAVFSRCCYIRFPESVHADGTTPEQYLCIGQPDILPGPLNLLTADVQTWRHIHSQLGKHNAVTVNSHAMLLGDTEVNFATAIEHDCCIPTIEPPLKLPVLHAQLQAWCEDSPSESLAATLFRTSVTHKQSSPSALQRACLGYMVPACEQLGYSLQGMLGSTTDSASDNPCVHRNCLAQFDSAAKALLGAGVGLTPAGDDCLAGVLLGLHYFGFPELAQRLLQRLQSDLSQATNGVSATLLQQAGEGKAGLLTQKMFHLFNASQPSAWFENQHYSASPIVRNSLPVAQYLDQQGHTSGWDCYAGVTLLSGAYVKSLSSKPTNYEVELPC